MNTDQRLDTIESIFLESRAILDRQTSQLKGIGMAISQVEPATAQEKTKTNTSLNQDTDVHSQVKEANGQLYNLKI